MSFRTFSLHQLGWRPDYAQHLTLDDFEAGTPARVFAMHAAGLEAYASGGMRRVDHPGGVDVAIGDWLMVERESPWMLRRLPRRSLLEGLAPDGVGHVANLDTLLVVLRGADDLAVTRAARQVALAMDAGIEPLVLAMASVGQVPTQLRATPVIVVADGGVDFVRRLAPWLVPGRTLAIAGSSGSATRGVIRALTAGASSRASVVGEAQVRAPDGLLATATGVWVIDLMARRRGQRATTGCGPCHAGRRAVAAVPLTPFAHS